MRGTLKRSEAMRQMIEQASFIESKTNAMVLLYKSVLGGENAYVFSLLVDIFGGVIITWTYGWWAGPFMNALCPEQGCGASMTFWEALSKFFLSLIIGSGFLILPFAFILIFQLIRVNYDFFVPKK